MYVYLVQMGNTDYFKIGVTAYKGRRLSGIKSCMPFDPSYKHLVDMKNKEHAEHVERVLHRQFKLYKTPEGGSEWFKFDNAVLGLVIEEMNRKDISEYDPTDILTTPRVGSIKMNAADRTKEMYEVLYKYGPKQLNKIIGTMGYKIAAEYLNCKKNSLIAIKIHFNASKDKLIPKNALDLITYFSDDLKREVDSRDSRQCMRCEKLLTVKNIRYHKIKHPGPMIISNCATLCVYCRSTVVLKAEDETKGLFSTMDNISLKKWIKENKPYIKRNRVYKSGQIGKW